MNRNKILILIPTYNELENVEKIINDILILHLDADLLFVDDNSPDGTGIILDKLSNNNIKINVIHRRAKLGVGGAHLQGIDCAYENKYDYLVTMDCDFTHSPSLITSFLIKAKEHDVVVGSRFDNKESLKGWNIARKILTYTGHFMTKFFLGIPYDATGAFRVYKIKNIPQAVFKKIRSNGYSFFFEGLYVLHTNDVDIVEMSINLPKRAYGHSKMKIKDIISSVILLASLFIRIHSHHKEFLVQHEVKIESSVPITEERKKWDKYWNKKTSRGKWLYDFIAAFYRKFIIKPTLNYFVNNYFVDHSEILHAGCGSGQVDIDIAYNKKITALDISPSALKKYSEFHNMPINLVHGSIDNIPSTGKNFDGIFNLGVMEHFKEPELKLILEEFSRVLKDDGKIILFWPPTYGLTVKVLLIVKKSLEYVLKRPIELHPDEHTLISSRQQADRIINGGGFKIVDYYFGIRDLYTHQVIVAEKIQP